MGGALPLALGACGGGGGSGGAALPVVAPPGWQLDKPIDPPEISISQGVGVPQKLAGAGLDAGFNLLTVDVFSGYHASPHRGGVWDEARQIMWLFGAETHAATGNYDNAVYRFDLADGKFYRQYAPDTPAGFPGDYRVDENGMLWATQDKTRPWAMHTYRRLRYVPASREIEVAYDPAYHAYAYNTTPPIEEGAVAYANRIKPFLYYHTDTGLWRYDYTAAAGQFNNADLYSPTHPCLYVEGTGWVQVTGDRITVLAPDKASHTVHNVFGGANAHYHSQLHQIGGELIKFGGDTEPRPATTLYSRHALADLAAKDPANVRPVADYPALNDIAIQNQPSVALPDGRIWFLGMDLTANLRAFILDPAADTVVDTGHSIGPIATDRINIAADGFIADWCAALQCVVFITHRFSEGTRVYAYLPT